MWVVTSMLLNKHRRSMLLIFFVYFRDAMKMYCFKKSVNEARVAEDEYCHVYSQLLLRELVKR